jgi:hypothetical protein
MILSQNAKITRIATRLLLTQLLIFKNMPPVRTILGETSGNRVRGKDLTPYKRGLVIRAHSFGVKEATIIREFELS